MRLPFEDELNFSAFVVHIDERNASQTLPILAAITEKQALDRMRSYIRKATAEPQGFACAQSMAGSGMV